MLVWLFIVVPLTVHALGLWMAIHVVMTGRSPQGAIAWVMALVLMPWLALPLYLIFGDRKFVGYERATPGGDREIDQIAQALTESLRPFAQAAAEEARLDHSIQKLAPFPPTKGNQVALLINGQATFDAIVKAIEGARKYVLVEYYTVRDDELGRRVQQALTAASGRGIRVYFLYDELGSHGLPSAYLQTLIDAGCECTGFRTKASRRRAFRLNFRNHRKIVIVDGRIAFVGGLNIGDEYLDLHPVLTPWRDTHMAIRGPAVQCVQMAFAEDWFWARRCVPDLQWSPQSGAAGHEGAEGGGAGDGATVLIVPSGPAHELETCSLLFTRMAETAKATLWLSTAYFVPDESFVAALQLAALRGVDVKAMIPEKSDSLSSKLSSFTYYKPLHPAGVRFFRYQKGFLHQKLALVDDLVCVGTANLDNRSFRLNFEISVLVSDPKFTSEVTDMLRADLSNSRLVDKNDLENRPYWFQFSCRVARMLAPVQ